MSSVRDEPFADHARSEGAQLPPRPWPLVWSERGILAVAAVCAVVLLRVPPSYVAWAFLPLVPPALLWLGWPLFRRRTAALVRALWNTVALYERGGRLPWGAAVVFVALPALWLFLSNNHTELIGDSWPVIRTAVSVVREGDTNLDEFCLHAPGWGDPRMLMGDVPYYMVRRGPHVYSAYPSGMVSLALPVAGLARLAGAKLGDPAAQQRLEKLTAAVVAAAAMAVFFLLALHVVRPAPALVTTVMLAVASGVFSTLSQNLWQHGGVVLGLLVLLLVEFRGPSRWGTAAQAVACATMLACRISALTFLAPFGVWVLARSPRRGVALGVLAGLAFLPWAAYYQAVYSNPLGPASSLLARSFWSADIGTRLAAILVSPGRGLVTYQPWVVLVVALAAVRLVRRPPAAQHPSGPRGWVAACVAAILLQTAMIAAWRCWWGGWCWGSRLLIETVPLWALLCARPVDLLWTRRGGRTLIFSLMLAGTLVQVPALYLGGFRWNAVAHAGDPEVEARCWSRAPFLAPFTLPPPGSLRPGLAQQPGKRLD